MPARKYEEFDGRLFAWLHCNRTDVTTSLAIQALGSTGATLERHVSRRFTQLEDRGILKCTLKGTTRVCSVESDPPLTLASKPWRTPKPVDAPRLPCSIPANDSNQFELAGGTIEKVESHWDKPLAAKAIGALTFTDYVNSLD